ncbi:MAG: aquaporin [Thermoleophilia bacterium]|nr:aquaporin [Thermoleophilia bacterium]
MKHTPSLAAKLLAEFVGTFALIAVGVGAVLFASGGSPATDLLGVALAHGLVIGVMVTAVGHVSGGHFNPAVSAAMIAMRKMTLLEGGMYIVVQLVGGVLGALFVKGMFPDKFGFDKYATVSLTSGLSPTNGMLLEAFCTFLLIWVIFAVAVDRDGAFGAVAGLPIGFTIALDILMIGPLTGGTMNPARWFGPNLVNGVWTDAWVWIVGPVLGALLAAAAYQFVVLGNDEEVVRDDIRKSL